MLDEPFGALDAKVRLELRRWLRQLHDEVGVTSVFVTHDQDEALEVADQVAVMNRGKIEQVGTPDDVYHRPATSFVYNFLGNVNLFHGRIDDGTARITARRPAISCSCVRTRWRSRASPTAPTTSGPKRSTSTRPDHSVKIEAITEWGAVVHVEMPQERFRALDLRTDEEVFITPRDLAVFEEGVGFPGLPWKLRGPHGFVDEGPGQAWRRPGFCVDRRPDTAGRSRPTC